MGPDVLPNSYFLLAGVITILATIAGLSLTVIKVTSIRGNDADKQKINDLNRSSAVQDEKINGIQSDVKEIKEDVRDLRKDLDEIKNLIIKGNKDNDERVKRD